jgi:hypothetical protein
MTTLNSHGYSSLSLAPVIFAQWPGNSRHKNGKEYVVARSTERSGIRSLLRARQAFFRSKWFKYRLQYATCIIKLGHKNSRCWFQWNSAHQYLSKIFRPVAMSFLIFLVRTQRLHFGRMSVCIQIVRILHRIALLLVTPRGVRIATVMTENYVPRWRGEQ